MMATQYAKASYEEIIDCHTEEGHVTAIGIHTPTGDTPRKMFSGFFEQFKKFKYLGCSIKLVPAARLPADPLQVSYEPGQVIGTAVDPRDMLNPLLFHGCHGNDLGTILNTLYTGMQVGDSLSVLDTPTSGAILPTAFRDLMEKLYYKGLTDKTWKKAMPQRGFIKSGLRPMIYSLATNRQIIPGNQGEGIDVADDGSIDFDVADPTEEWELDTSYKTKTSLEHVQLFTPRLQRLGWLDTRNVLTKGADMGGEGVTTIDDAFFKQINYAELPEIFMGVILLPPAYGVEQYYRMIIDHYFEFKGFRGISFKPEIGSVPSYFQANDLDDVQTFSGTDHLDGNSTGGDSPGGVSPLQEISLVFKNNSAASVSVQQRAAIVIGSTMIEVGTASSTSTVTAGNTKTWSFTGLSGIPVGQVIQGLVQLGSGAGLYMESITIGADDVSRTITINYGS